MGEIPRRPQKEPGPCVTHRLYDHAMANGALGGKLIGAGEAAAS